MHTFCKYACMHSVTFVASVTVSANIVKKEEKGKRLKNEDSVSVY